MKKIRVLIYKEIIIFGGYFFSMEKTNQLRWILLVLKKNTMRL